MLMPNRPPVFRSPGSKAGRPRVDLKPKRPTSWRRGYDADWRKLRDRKREADPWCEECARHGRRVRMRHVDHKIPVKRRPDLRLVWSNLQSLCDSCHSRKTAAEDGGFGNPTEGYQE